MKTFDLSLYLVTDGDLTRGRSLEYIVREAVEGGVTLVQLREKNRNNLEFYHEALKLGEILREYKIPLIINDRPDIVLAVEADGLHIGQHDLPYPVARKIIGPDKIIGLSVENLQQAQNANNLDVDYIAISPVFSTPTKTDTSAPLGLEGIRKISAISKHPCVAIGGLNTNNAFDAIICGASGIAVISAIISSENPKKASQELKKNILNAKKIQNEVE